MFKRIILFKMKELLFHVDYERATFGGTLKRLQLLDNRDHIALLILLLQ